MDAFLTDISAAQIWFTNQDVIRGTKPLETIPSYSTANVSASELPKRELSLLGIKTPYHLAVPKQERRRSSQCIICHSMADPPRHTFVRLSKHVYATGPIPTLITLANRIPLGHLMLLINQILGRYQILNRSVVERRPMATIRNIETYLNSLYHVRGSARVRRLLAYAVENTASPEEARLAALLLLPEDLGGKGLPPATSNERIQTMDAHLASPRYPDLFWKQHRLVLEYESDEFHTGKDSLGKDSARRAQLQAAGYHVVTMTNRQLHNPVEFEDAVRALRRYMGLELKTPNEPLSSFSEKECGLRDALYRFSLKAALGI